MKRVLLTIFLCWVSLGHAADVRFVDGDDGNDSTGDGLAFVTAWLTLGKAVTDGQAAGDTVVCVGKFTEELAPTADGTNAAHIVFIDSLRYTDGVNSTKPDTSWTAIIDGADVRSSPIDLNNDDYFDFIGFEVQRTGTGAQGIHAQGGSDNTIFWQMRVIDAETATGPMINIEGAQGDTTEIRSCVFIQTTGAVDRGIQLMNSGSGLIRVLNNTVRGNFSAEGLLILLTSTGNIELKNNIIYNTSATASDFTIDLDGTISQIDAYVHDFNNNLYFEDNLTAWCEWDATTLNTIAVWEDSVNNHDADGASNSLNTDPSLQAVTTTAFILNTSAAAEAGVDLGFGNDIGCYQTDPVSTARRRPTIIL